MSILTEGETQVAPQPHPSMVGGAIQPGQKLVMRNVGPVPCWLGDINILPHQGIPLLCGESFSTDDPSGNGIWAVTENNPTIPGVLDWFVTDAFDPSLGAARVPDAVLIGAFAISNANNQTQPVFLDLPVAGWEALGIMFAPNNFGLDAAVRAVWSQRSPQTGMLSFDYQTGGGFPLFGPWFGPTTREQHCADCGAGGAVTTSYGFRDVWANQGDYLSVYVETGSHGSGSSTTGTLMCWLTNRTRLGGFPPNAISVQSGGGSGLTRTLANNDTGRLLSVQNATAAAGSNLFVIPPYAGAVKVWAATGASVFPQIYSRRVDEAPGVNGGDEIWGAGAGLTTTTEVVLPPLINTFVLNNTGAAAPGQFASIIPSFSRSNP